MSELLVHRATVTTSGDETVANAVKWVSENLFQHRGYCITKVLISYGGTKDGATMWRLKVTEAPVQ